MPVAIRRATVRFADGLVAFLSRVGPAIKGAMIVAVRNVAAWKGID